MNECVTERGVALLILTAKKVVVMGGREGKQRKRRLDVCVCVCEREREMYIALFDHPNL